MVTKAVIQLDVPEWQIGQDVSVYFPDTMLKHGKCEMMKEQEPVKPEATGRFWLCGKCGTYVGFEDNEFYNYCYNCGTPVLWKGGEKNET